MDQARFDKVGELFADGKLLSPGQVMEGKEGVSGQLEKNLQVYADGTPRTAHITTNTVLDIKEDKEEATAVSYLTILQDDSKRGFPPAADLNGNTGTDTPESAAKLIVDYALKHDLSISGQFFGPNGVLPW